MVTRTKRLRQGAMALMAAAGLVAGGMQLSAASAHPRATHQQRARGPHERPPSSTWWSCSTRTSRSTTTSAPTPRPRTPTARRSTPQATRRRTTNLVTSGALTNNPNAYAPTRLTHAQNATCSQNHNYTPEQKAVNGGAMDKFVESTSVDTCTGLYGSPGLAMDYFDGNTVTGLWNYAQNYAMSDNIVGHHVRPVDAGRAQPGLRADARRNGVRPQDGCAADRRRLRSPAPTPTVSARSSPTRTRPTTTARTTTTPRPRPSSACRARTSATDSTRRTSSWGWFQGGFTPSTAWDGVKGDYAKCESTTTNIDRADTSRDYSRTTRRSSTTSRRPTRTTCAPKSLAEVGHNGRANHNYDLSYFDKAVKANSLPAVSLRQGAAGPGRPRVATRARSTSRSS